MQILKFIMLIGVFFLQNCTSNIGNNMCNYIDIWGEPVYNINDAYSKPENDARKYYEINGNSVIISFDYKYQKYDLIYIDEINGNRHNTVPIISEKYIDLMDKLSEKFFNNLNNIAIIKELNEQIQINEDEFMRAMLHGDSYDKALDMHCYQNSIILDYIKRFRG